MKVISNGGSFVPQNANPIGEIKAVTNTPKFKLKTRQYGTTAKFGDVSESRQDELDIVFDRANKGQILVLGDNFLYAYIASRGWGQRPMEQWSDAEIIDFAGSFPQVGIIGYDFECVMQTFSAINHNAPTYIQILGKLTNALANRGILAFDYYAENGRIWWLSDSPNEQHNLQSLYKTIGSSWNQENTLLEIVKHKRAFDNPNLIQDIDVYKIDQFTFGYTNIFYYNRDNEGVNQEQTSVPTCYLATLDKMEIKHLKNANKAKMLLLYPRCDSFLGEQAQGRYLKLNGGELAEHYHIPLYPFNYVRDLVTLAMIRTKYVHCWVESTQIFQNPQYAANGTLNISTGYANPNYRVLSGSNFAAQGNDPNANYAGELTHHYSAMFWGAYQYSQIQDVIEGGTFTSVTFSFSRKTKTTPQGGTINAVPTGAWYNKSAELKAPFVFVVKNGTKAIAIMQDAFCHPSLTTQIDFTFEGNNYTFPTRGNELLIIEL